MAEPTEKSLNDEIAEAFAEQGLQAREILASHEAVKPREEPKEPAHDLFRALDALEVEAKVRTETRKQQRAEGRPRPPSEDLTARAHQKALEMLARDRAAREAVAQARAKGKRPPQDLVAMRAQETYSEFVVDDTEIDPALVKPEHKTRWVRTVDTWGRPDPRLSRVRQHQNYGGEVIRTPDGKPLVGPYGVAMQLPLDGVAARIKHSAPRGMAEIADLNGQVVDEVEHFNRAYGGKEAVRLIGEGAQPDRSLSSQ